MTTRAASSRARAIAAAVVAAAALIAVAVLAIAVGGRGRDGFGGGSISDLESALEAGGLAVCATAADDGRDDGPVAVTEIVVGADSGCGVTAVVQADEYADEQSRDAAAREAESRHRPRAYGAVYTWRQFTLYLQADEANRDGDLTDRIAAALDAAGAR